MTSLGVIETHGLVAAIQAADAACKSAAVTCTGYRKIGAGRVSVCLEGEISAIQAAVESGVNAVLAGGQQATSLVIARPEDRVKQAVTGLSGYPSDVPLTAERCTTEIADVVEPVLTETERFTDSASLSVSVQPEKQTAMKKGKKS